MMSITSVAGIESLRGEQIAHVMGELNREATCIAFAATPPELTPIGEINENLRAKGAFDLVGHRTFNVSGILKSMPDLVEYVSDPSPQHGKTAWAAQKQGPGGELSHFTTGFAGALLEFSDTHRLQLRTLIGEKRHARDGRMHSVEVRLGILAAIGKFTQEGRSFSSGEVSERTEEFGLDPTTVRSHLYKLTDHGYLKGTGRLASRRYELTERRNGIETPDTIFSLMRLVGGFAIGLPDVMQKGVDSAYAILNDRGRLPKLVKKSYDATKHTGKNSARRSA